MSTKNKTNKSTTRPANDFDSITREFQSIARLIAAMPAAERTELRNRLDEAMNANDQLRSLSTLLVSLVIPQAVQ